MPLPFAKVSPLSLFVSPLFAVDLDAGERAAVAEALRDQPAGRDLARLPAVAPLTQQVEALAERVLEELKCEQRGARVARLWLEELPAAAPGQVLLHPNAYLGGLYRPDGTTPETVLFQDPRPQVRLLQAPLEAATPLTAGEASVPLPAGRLLLFPAYLLHQPVAAPHARRLVRFAVSFRRYAERLAPPRWTGMTAGQARDGEA